MYRQALEALANSPAVVDGLAAVVRDAPFDAVFFETPPVAPAVAGQLPFEFVLVSAPSLARVRADPDTFSKYMACGQDGVTAFPNLGRDAMLVIPCRDEDTDVQAFAHIRSFHLRAPAAQVHAFWQRIARFQPK